MPYSKIIVSLTLAALLVGTSAVTSAQAEEASKPVPGEQAKPAQKEQSKPDAAEPLVTVNGRPITRLEFDRSMKILLTQGKTPALPPDALKKAQEEVLEQLINSEVLYQQSQVVELKELEKLVKQQMEENRSRFASEAAYQAALSAMQMTPKEAEEFTRRDVAINALLEKEFAGKGTVSEGEAKKFYEENLDRYFTTPESIRASHILIAVSETATSEERKKGREKAEAILKRLKGGEDFSSVARAESNCPSSAKGGDLGRFPRGAMVVPFEKAAFSLKPGELSEVVETQFGFHIIRLDERFPARSQQFEEVKGKIVEYLKREKIGRELPGYLKSLREKAKIERVEKMQQG